MGWSRIYESLKTQVSIEDIGSNAYFIEPGGRNDCLDVNKTPLLTILRMITLKNYILCHRKESKFTGGPVPKFPVPYSHKYWAVP